MSLHKFFFPLTASRSAYIDIILYGIFNCSVSSETLRLFLRNLLCLQA